jgi:hypothetical protein
MDYFVKVMKDWKEIQELEKIYDAIPREVQFDIKFTTIVKQIYLKKYAEMSASIDKRVGEYTTTHDYTELKTQEERERYMKLLMFASIFAHLAEDVRRNNNSKS